MCVKRLTAPGPRIPRPMKPTRTVGMGSWRRPRTSFCPAGRTGTGVLMMREAGSVVVCVVRTPLHVALRLPCASAVVPRSISPAMAREAISLVVLIYENSIGCTIYFAKSDAKDNENSHT